MPSVSDAIVITRNLDWDYDTLAWVEARAFSANPAGGNVNVLNFPATQAVTGTFWQATQPISHANLASVATATTSQVADNAASQQLLASNAARLGAAIENDSSAVLYVKLGTTASSTDYTARLERYGYFEVPYRYTGRIDGIWSSDPNDGAARITELT